MNTVTITGRLVEDMRLNSTPNGVEVANGKMATQRNFKNQQGEYEADFIEFTVWRGKAPVMAEYIKKGDFFGITGRLESRMRERDGVKYPELKVIVDDFDFPNKPKKDNQQQQKDNSPLEEAGFPTDQDDLPFMY